MEMNQNKKVVSFTLTAALLFLAYSVYVSFARSTFLSLDKVSIVSDILHAPVGEPVADTLPDSGLETATTFSDTTMVVDTAVAAKSTDTVKTAKFRHLVYHDDHIVPSGPSGNKSLGSYVRGGYITNFSGDTSQPALPVFMHKLAALRKGKKGKVRIAWFGDSMIEGDLLTKTFRKKMQQYFGGYGVGFVAATSVTSAFRNTINHKWKGDWKEENFKTDDPSQPLFLSGHTFFTTNGEISLTDKTAPGAGRPLEKSLICGQMPGDVEITVNGTAHRIRPTGLINRFVLDSTPNGTINVAIRNHALPVYGLSVEPEFGVVVDNFSFRGITGLELGKLDTTFLRALDTVNSYDLVVLEYGANLMFRPDDNDYSWYRKHIIGVVARLRKMMPNTEFLIVSTADRAFNYNNTWKTAVGIDNLVKTQAELALVNDAAFYNMYRSMGGPGTIVRWAESSPALANKDYIHPNFLGADILGNMMYEAFLRDFRKTPGSN